MARRSSAREEPVDADRDLGPPADPAAVARTILLAKLTGQARSRDELARALDAKAVPVDVARTVLDRFEDVGLINDQAFAEAWVESRQASRGSSRLHACSAIANAPRCITPSSRCSSGTVPTSLTAL